MVIVHRPWSVTSTKNVKLHKKELDIIDLQCSYNNCQVLLSDFSSRSQQSMTTFHYKNVKDVEYNRLKVSWDIDCTSKLIPKKLCHQKVIILT